MTDPDTPFPTPELEPPADPDLYPTDVPVEVPEPDLPGGGDNDPRPYDAEQNAKIAASPA